MSRHSMVVVLNPYCTKSRNESSVRTLTQISKYLTLALFEQAGLNYLGNLDGHFPSSWFIFIPVRRTNCIGSITCAL